MLPIPVFLWPAQIDVEVPICMMYNPKPFQFQ